MPGLATFSCQGFTRLKSKCAKAMVSSKSSAKEVSDFRSLGLGKEVISLWLAWHFKVRSGEGLFLRVSDFKECQSPLLKDSPN